MKLPRYTAEDEALLEQMAGRMPYKEIARFFNLHSSGPKRSAEAIKKKIQKMGLSTKPTEDYVCTERLAELLGIKGATIRRWFKLGLKSSSSGFKAPARIRLEDVSAFFQSRPDKLRFLSDEVIQWLDPKLLPLKPREGQYMGRRPGQWLYIEAKTGISAPKKWILAKRLKISRGHLYDKARAGRIQIVERRIA